MRSANYGFGGAADVRRPRLRVLHLVLRLVLLPYPSHDLFSLVLLRPELRAIVFGLPQLLPQLLGLYEYQGLPQSASQGLSQSQRLADRPHA